MKETEELEDSQIYELGFHILPTVSEDKIGEVFSAVQNSITKNGGTIISEDFPKLKALAYDINKKIETKNLVFNKAYFGWVKFDLPTTHIEKLSGEMENNENILRFIAIKTVKENTISALKPLMTGKEAPKEEKTESVEPVKEKMEVSEEEIDKGIDKLVLN